MKTIIFSPSGSVRVIADSAIGRNRQPWFLPDFGHDWVWHSAPALRISRLGKSVRSEFADRYVEDRSLAWIPESADNPAADFMDGALVVGDWIPLGAEGLSPREREAIVNVSRYSTLKQGDILILDSQCETLPIEINDKIKLDLDGETVLEVNVK